MKQSTQGTKRGGKNIEDETKYPRNKEGKKHKERMKQSTPGTKRRKPRPKHRTQQAQDLEHPTTVTSVKTEPCQQHQHQQQPGSGTLFGRDMLHQPRPAPTCIQIDTDGMHGRRATNRISVLSLSFCVCVCVCVCVCCVFCVFYVSVCCVFCLCVSVCVCVCVCVCVVVVVVVVFIPF